MSSYCDRAINPRTGEVEMAWFLDDYFGRHCYGVRFESEEHVYRQSEVKIPKEPSHD